MTAARRPTIYVKRYATGKFTAMADGGTNYDDALARAFMRSGYVSATMDEKRFRTAAAELGVPADVIDATWKSLRISDDTYDVEESPRY
jgi:hypothetical protein